MHKKTLLLTTVMLLTLLLTACGKDPQVTQFKQDIDNFCSDISAIDTVMNTIDATSDYAREELLGYLDDLDKHFLEFADLDFPKDFDYLEPLADEASKYMTEAVTYYHKAYAEAEKYDETHAAYATENYSRAWKRIQIIISFLHGEEPEDVIWETE